MSKRNLAADAGRADRATLTPAKVAPLLLSSNYGEVPKHQRSNYYLEEIIRLARDRLILITPV
ncbi:MAG: hypothetical protein ABIU29_07315, partial [Chthoniobacterales bacterium]